MENCRSLGMQRHGVNVHVQGQLKLNLGTIHLLRSHRGGRGWKKWPILRANVINGCPLVRNAKKIENAKNNNRTPKTSTAANNAHHYTSPFHYEMSIWSSICIQEHGFWRQPRLLKANGASRSSASRVIGRKQMIKLYMQYNFYRIMAQGPWRPWRLRPCAIIR